jgi:hypothetical protein
VITVEYIRSTAVGLAPITMFCDPAKRGCGAGRGSFCRSSGGYNVPFHAPRKAAVAGMSDDEKYEAYRQMRAEQEQRHREAEAAMRRPLTAEQQRVRTATREAWQRAGREAAADLKAQRERRRSLSPIRGPGGATVLDITARLAARNASTPRGAA